MPVWSICVAQVLYVPASRVDSFVWPYSSLVHTHVHSEPSQIVTHGVGACRVVPRYHALAAVHSLVPADSGRRLLALHMKAVRDGPAPGRKE